MTREQQLEAALRECLSGLQSATETIEAAAVAYEMDGFTDFPKSLRDANLVHKETVATAEKALDIDNKKD